jgi:hypothetical protein
MMLFQFRSSLHVEESTTLAPGNPLQLCETTREHRVDAGVSTPTLFGPAGIENAINVEKDDFHRGSWSAIGRPDQILFGSR